MKTNTSSYIFPVFLTRAGSLALAATLVLALSACGDAEEEALEGEEEVALTEEWGYEGSAGPANWASLNETYATCDEGAVQSPIDVTDAALVQADSLQALGLDYGAASAQLDTSGYVVKMDVGEGQLSFQGQTYSLAQFHFHAPSEHAISGTEYPAEVHFVHQNEAGGLAVVGVMIEEGDANAAFADALAASGEGSAEVDPAALMPSEGAYYTYQGSLTTPPCTEGVRWILMQEPITMSAEQIERLNLGVPESDRPVQPLGEREVLAFEG